jgi:hypothetical protein
MRCFSLREHCQPYPNGIKMIYLLQNWRNLAKRKKGHPANGIAAASQER